MTDYNPGAMSVLHYIASELYQLYVYLICYELENLIMLESGP